MARKLTAAEIGIVINETGDGRTRKNTEFTEEDINPDEYLSYQDIIKKDPTKKHVPIEAVAEIMADQLGDESVSFEDEEISFFKSEPVKDLRISFISRIAGVVSVFVGDIGGIPLISEAKSVLNAKKSRSVDGENDWDFIEFEHSAHKKMAGVLNLTMGIGR